MDCRIALEILESARPDSDDLLQAELSAAAEHLESCADCETRFVKRQELDRRIGGLLRDVAIPAGLHARLMESVTGAVTAEVESLHDPPPSAEKTHPNRRRRMHVAVTASACLLMVVGVVSWFLAGQRSGMLPLDALQTGEQTAEALSNPARLPNFDGEYTPVLPSGWPSRLWTRKRPRAMVLGDRTLALYEFSLRRGRRKAVRGVLLVVPADWVDGVPGERSLGRALGSTGHFYNGRFAGAAWTEQAFVYVCFVRGSDDGLDTLQRAVERPPA